MGTMNNEQKAKMATTRIMHALNRNGINSLYDLHNTPLEVIAKFRCLGEESMLAIKVIKNILEQCPEMREAPKSDCCYTGKLPVISFATREDGGEFFRRLMNLLNEQGKVSIDDIQDIVGIPYQYSHSAYGWTSLDGFHMFKMNETNEWHIHLPSPVRITKSKMMFY